MSQTTTLTDIPEPDLLKVVKDFTTDGAAVQVRQMPTGLWAIDVVFPEDQSDDLSEVARSVEKKKK